MVSAPSRPESERFAPPAPARPVPLPATAPEPEAAAPRAAHPRLAVALSLGMAAAGSLALAAALRTYIGHPGAFPLVFVLIAALVGAVPLPAYGSTVSLSPVPIVAAAFLSGMPGAVCASFAAAVGLETRPHRHGWRCLFNLGAFATAGLISGLIGTLLARAAGSLSVPVYLLLFGLATAGSLHFANVVPACLGIVALAGGRPLAVWRERFQWMAPQTLLLGPVGTGVALAYRYAGVYELLAFALPMVAMHIAWRQYLAHTTRSVEDLRQKNADLIYLAARLQAANDQVNIAYRGTLEALVGALDARDNEVQGHSYRVSAYSQILAERLGIERGSLEWETIARGALLHDVGKIGIRDAVLQKPGALDDGEWAEMRTHAEIGFGILRGIDFLQPAAALVQAHHERYDGQGYPRGLKGDEIPLGARIFSVADTFDAITTDRPYRRAMPPEVAVAEIQRCAGTQFDPTVVEVFLDVWRELWAIRPEAVSMVA